MPPDDLELRTLGHLEDIFATVLDHPLENLPTTCDQVLGHVIQLAHGAFVQALQECLNKKGSSLAGTAEGWMIAEPRTHERPPRILYSVRITSDPNRSDTLICAAVAADPPRDPATGVVSSVATLDAAAPFSRIAFALHDSLAEHHADIQSAVVTTLNAGYRWLEEFCTRRIQSDQDDAIDELYRIVRSYVPDMCRERVWLYLLSQPGSVYVFDKLAQKSVIQHSRGVSSRFGQSGSQVLAKLAGYPAKPEATSDFKVVIPTDATYIHDPLHGVNDGDEIALPQYILFGGKNLAVQPLVGGESGHLGTGAMWLTAAYPIEIRESVEARLKAVRPLLQKVIRDRVSLRASMAKRLKARLPSNRFTALGEFTGAALGELFKRVPEILKALNG